MPPMSTTVRTMPAQGAVKPIPDTRTGTVVSTPTLPRELTNEEIEKVFVTIDILPAPPW